MARSPNTILSIERFAQMLALLDGGVPNRDAFLMASGFNHSTWRHVQEQWLPRLATGDATYLAATFARSYAETRLGTLGRAPGWTPDHAVEFDETCEAAVVQRSAPPLPFVALAPVPLQEEETCKVLTVQIRPVLPFTPTSSGPPRFDTQTGEPLPTSSTAPRAVPEPSAAGDGTASVNAPGAEGGGDGAASDSKR